MTLPTPFYQDKMTTVYGMDCVAGMKALPDNMYDGLMTSPPYGVGKEYESEQSFGDYLKLLADFTQAAYHCMKPGGYMVINYADFYLFDGINTKIQPMTYLYHVICERVGWTHYCQRIWQKDYASLTDPYTISHLLPKLEYEHIAVFIKPGGKTEVVREQNLHPRAIWSTAGIKQPKATLKDHPAAYPEALVAMVLKVYADPGQHWIEPFCGNGTTPYVAKKMGIFSTSFELNQKYLPLIKRRLEQQAFDFDNVLGEREVQIDMEDILAGNVPPQQVEQPVDLGGF